MEEHEQARRAEALQLVRGAYEAVALFHGTTPELLERINRPRPSWMRYGSTLELVREYLHCAGAVSTFAVNVGLITPEEAAQVIRDFTATHPEMDYLEDAN
jgi:hypothetical protein